MVGLGPGLPDAVAAGIVAVDLALAALARRRGHRATAGAAAVDALEQALESSVRRTRSNSKASTMAACAPPPAVRPAAPHRTRRQAGQAVTTPAAPPQNAKRPNRD